MRFADRAHDVFFNDGPLYVDSVSPEWAPAHPERNRPAGLYAALADHVQSAVPGESARWGDIRGGSPYRSGQWSALNEAVFAVEPVADPMNSKLRCMPDRHVHGEAAPDHAGGDQDFAYRQEAILSESLVQRDPRHPT